MLGGPESARQLDCEVTRETGRSGITGDDANAMKKRMIEIWEGQTKQVDRGFSKPNILDRLATLAISKLRLSVDDTTRPTTLRGCRDRAGVLDCSDRTPLTIIAPPIETSVGDKTNKYALGISGTTPNWVAWSGSRKPRNTTDGFDTLCSPLLMFRLPDDDRQELFLSPDLAHASIDPYTGDVAINILGEVGGINPDLVEEVFRRTSKSLQLQ